MVEAADLTDQEREAIHEVERGTEWVRRAHGALVEFHHAVGTAMDHYTAAVNALDEDYPGLATRLEDEVLPAAMTDEGHLTYQIVEEFEEGFLSTVDDVTDEARDEIVDDERYVVERGRHEEARSSGGDRSASSEEADRT